MLQMWFIFMASQVAFYYEFLSTKKWKHLLKEMCKQKRKDGSSTTLATLNCSLLSLQDYYHLAFLMFNVPSILALGHFDLRFYSKYRCDWVHNG